MCFILEEDSNVAVEKLTVMKEVLLGTEPCKPKLDRSLKVRVHLLSSFVNFVFLKKLCAGVTTIFQSCQAENSLNF